MRSYATISATGFTQTDHAGLVKLMWEWHETIDQFIASCKAKMINQSRRLTQSASGFDSMAMASAGQSTVIDFQSFPWGFAFFGGELEPFWGGEVVPSPIGTRSRRPMYITHIMKMVEPCPHTAAGSCKRNLECKRLA